MPRLSRAAALLLLLLVLSSCGAINRVVSRAATGYLEDGALVYQRDPDPRLAADGIPANFKLLEILLHRTPDDPRLLVLAAQYLATYTYAFVEPEVERLEYDDPAASAVARTRASALYLRARNYALRALQVRGFLKDGLETPLPELTKALERIGPRQTRPLFWTAFSWGSYVNLNLDQPVALADSGSVSAMMRLVLTLDETFYYGGAHLFFGALEATLPMSAGGDPERSKAHFERAINISQGRLLMTKVFFARYYAVRIQDRALFGQMLREVLAYDMESAPDERLANTLAKARAALYLERADEYFLEDADPTEDTGNGSMLEE